MEFFVVNLGALGIGTLDFITNNSKITILLNQRELQNAMMYALSLLGYFNPHSKLSLKECLYKEKVSNHENAADLYINLLRISSRFTAITLLSQSELYPVVEVYQHGCHGRRDARSLI